MTRNYVVLGTWSPRTNLGSTLYVSNNDCAQPHILQTIDAGCYAQTHANKSAEEAQLVVSLGEHEYDRRRIADSLAWMKNHPEKTAALALARFREFWFPQRKEQSPYAEAVWVITLLSLPGFIWMARARLPAWKYMLAVCAVVPLPYYVVVADIRYRTPLLWVAQITAGYALSRVWSRRSRAREAAFATPGIPDTPSTQTVNR